MEIFKIGDKIIYNPNGSPKGKVGIIKYIRDSTYERNMKSKNPLDYYYCVQFDDGTSNTYISGLFIKKYE